MSNYITEAFKQLNLLESEDISLDASGITELRSFLDDAAVDPDEEMMDIYDLKAEAEEDLAKSYEGKVVLECTVCHRTSDIRRLLLRFCPACCYHGSRFQDDRE